MVQFYNVKSKIAMLQIKAKNLDILEATGKS